MAGTPTAMIPLDRAALQTLVEELAAEFAQERTDDAATAWREAGDAILAQAEEADHAWLADRLQDAGHAIGVLDADAAALRARFHAEQVRSEDA